MGKNNRQRRAARQRARQHRGPTPPRPGGPQPATEDVGFRFGPSAEQLRRQATERRLDQLVMVGSDVGPRELRRYVQHELTGQDQSDLTLLDELMTARVRQLLIRAWEHGWLPLDIVHLARRAGGRLVPLAAQAIGDYAEQANAARLAPPAWRDQLAAVTEEQLLVAQPASGPAGLVAADVWRGGIGSLDVWCDVVQLAGVLSRLPKLEQVMPPPSAWGSQRVVAPPAGSSERDVVLNRVRALLAKAEATEFAAEAEVFTAKAQDLMTRHALDEALLHSSTEQIDVDVRRVHLRSPYTAAKVLLLDAVGRANRTKVIFLDAFDMATVVGTPVDVDQVEMLFTSLLIQATRAMAEAGASRSGSFDRSATFRRSFLSAYAVRIGERLMQADRQAAASYGSELVPVLRRQTEAVEDEFARLFPSTRTMRGGYLDQRGWEAGRKAADRAVFTAGRLSA
ncbi:MAG TPA: DUF2786 domain-containing protein [Propionibacteriaceae bacterium]|nr:DUF2786 domain-containing protein [Propionibacteriaceae bacterium]